MSTPSKTNWDGYIALLLAGLLVWSAMGKSGSILSPPPIPEPGLHVLIVEETEDRGKVPPSQANIFTSVALREYLDSKAKGWRIFDQDVDLRLEAKLWQDAMARDRESLPWIVISNGKSGHEGPLPETVAATIDLIKKYEAD